MTISFNPSADGSKADILVGGVTKATVYSSGKFIVPGNQVAFSARGTPGNQSVTTTTSTKVNLNIEDFDTAGAFDSVTNSRFQPTVAGYYQFTGIVRIQATGTTLTAWFAELWKNGVAYIRGSESNVTATATVQQSIVSGIIYLNGTTDYVELYGYAVGTTPAFHNDTSTNAGSCFLQGSLVFPT